MRIAVIGAGGQIGSYLVRALSRESGNAVVAVCRNAIGAAVLRTTMCEVRLGSVSEYQSARSLLDDCDAVVNCAIATGLPKQSRQVNRAIIGNLARLPRVKCVIHLSSVAVYGNCINSERSTFDHPRPDSDYGNAKLDLERHLTRVFRTRKATVYLVRLGHVYGANQAMSRAILALAQTRDFAIPFDGKRPSNAIHLAEVGGAVAEMLAGTVPGGIYNLAGNPHRTWREIFDWHTDLTGLRPVPALPMEVSEDLRKLLSLNERFPVVKRFARETARWIRGLPSSYISSCPTVKDLGYAVLRSLPSRIEKLVKARYATLSARQAIQGAGKTISHEPWLFSDEMPGVFLPYSASPEFLLSRHSESAEQLLNWYRGLIDPRWSFKDYIGSRV